MSGQLLISLDFELLWGVRDRRAVADYGDAILGGRRAIPVMLSLFARHAIRATWACVGLLFFRNRSELLAGLPEERPAYTDPRLNPYLGIEATVGQNEEDDPFHYGYSLVARIAETPGQEIGTHTFSHYYCLEEGQSIDAFDADLTAARKVAERLGIRLKSIVFPRNQMTTDHVAACAGHGIIAYRGNPKGMLYKPRARADHSIPVRLGRYIDSLMAISASQTHPLVPTAQVPRNIAASRFLRPHSGFAPQNRMRIARIMAEMTIAARTGSLYHLWWHPHNFGRRTDGNMRDLELLIGHYRALRSRYGMESVTMADLAERGLAAAA